MRVEAEAEDMSDCEPSGMRQCDDVACMWGSVPAESGWAIIIPDTHTAMSTAAAAPSERRVT